MVQRRTAVAILVALVLVQGAEAQVDAELDETVDFESFTSYAIREGTPARRIEVQARIDGFVKRELDQRGLVLVEQSPDLVVRTYTLVSKLTLEQLADETTWKFYTGLTDMDAYSVKAGTLVVDVTDGTGDELLWRGLIAAPVSGSVASVERKLDKAVRKLFRRFPR